MRSEWSARHGEIERLWRLAALLKEVILQIIESPRFFLQLQSAHIGKKDKSMNIYMYIYIYNIFKNTCRDSNLHGKLEEISCPDVLTVNSQALGLIARVAELKCQ